jgi:hypothetical protein
MDQPIPAEKVRALHLLVLEKENAQLRHQIAADKLESGAQLLFAQHGVRLGEWSINTANGEMQPIPQAPAAPTEAPSEDMPAEA